LQFFSGYRPSVFLKNGETFIQAIDDQIVIGGGHWLKVVFHRVTHESISNILIFHEAHMGLIPTMPLEPCGLSEMDSLGPSAAGNTMIIARRQSRTDFNATAEEFSREGAKSAKGYHNPGKFLGSGIASAKISRPSRLCLPVNPVERGVLGTNTGRRARRNGA
jgi:hypothetical protein